MRVRAYRIPALLLHVWRFRVWSDTRWLGFGHGARVLLFSLFLGFEDLARFALNAGCSSYYIGGVLRNLTGGVRRLLAVVGISCRVSNVALSLLLKMTACLTCCRTSTPPSLQS